MMKKLLIAAFLAVAVTTTSYAAVLYATAKSLLEDCEHELGGKQYGCRMYLAGVSDTQGTFHAWENLPGKYFCIPYGVTNQKLREVFIEYVNDNPQTLNQAASSIAINAFEKAFPCGQDA